MLPINRRLVVAAVLVALALVIALIPTSGRGSLIAGPTTSGQWITNLHTYNVHWVQECPADTICADWETDGQSRLGSCCIPEDQLFTKNPFACQDWRPLH